MSRGRDEGATASDGQMRRRREEVEGRRWERGRERCRGGCLVADAILQQIVARLSYLAQYLVGGIYSKSIREIHF